MQFNSLYFILFFLPLTLLVYYAAGRKSAPAADWLLIAASFLFYGAADVWYPVMLAALILINWGITLRIRSGKAVPGGNAHRKAGRDDGEELKEKRGKKESGERDVLSQKGQETARAAKRWMILGVVLNVGFLGFFKYTNFFIGSLNAALQTDWPLVSLILPLGISFIIFSQISWLVDVFRNEDARRGGVCFREYVLFSTFFPKLSQGPITLMRDFLPQLRRRGRHFVDTDAMVRGIQMFALGLAKKVLIADLLGTAVSWYFDTILYRTNVDSFVVMLAYTFQIYFDFSGYSDMALGVSEMLGFHLPANFNSPYRACSVTDFWRRWHISLTTFLREYIYFPLGGSRRGTPRTYRNILIIYLISGLWHGASWTYVIWGLCHGLAQMAERALGRWYLRIWRPVRWVITFAFVNLTWMIFRCGSWAEFRRYWWHLRVDRTWTLSMDFAENFRIPGVARAVSLLGLPGGDMTVYLVSILLLFAFCLFICLCLPNNQERRPMRSAVSVLFIAGLLGVCLLSMSGVSTFIYNDF